MTSELLDPQNSTKDKISERKYLQSRCGKGEFRGKGEKDEKNGR